MAAPGVFDNFRRIRRRNGGDGDFDIFPASQPIAASQTVKKYDILSLNSSGALAQSIALPSANSGSASGGNLPIAGVALCDFTTDANGLVTSPNQAGFTVAGSASSMGCPPVAKWTDVELCMRLYNATATSTQQDDVVIGYSNYQFQRWCGASSAVWWYSLITTTTNGEFVIVERSLEAVGSALTDNYGFLWCRPAISNTIRQV